MKSRLRMRPLAMLCSILLTAGCASNGSIARATKANNLRLYGLDFSPYLDGQSPLAVCCREVNPKQIRERLQIIARHTMWVRTYSVGNGLGATGAIAHQLGLKVAIGAWLGKDDAANEREINELIRLSELGDVDMAVVGSEALLRGDLPEDILIHYIERVREAIPKSIPVTTADGFRQYLSHPKLVSVVDVLFVNYYPYWEGVDVDHALPALNHWHATLMAAAHGKPVIVSETGWPSAGNPIGRAVPSPENASQYFRDFVSWARSRHVKYFYFAAFDENWKEAIEGPQGARWGLWDSRGRIKSPQITAIIQGDN